MLPRQTQDSLQMLWLATYLTGFPPPGLYALNWAHGLTLSVCLNSNISASYPDEYNVWKYTTPLDSKKAAIHNCLLYSRISYYFSNGIQFHNSNNFIFPVSFSHCSLLSITLSIFSVLSFSVPQCSCCLLQ